MPWFKVDDTFHSHPKRARISPSAAGLWVTAGSWCAQHLSDGFVPRHVLSMLGGRQRDAQMLVESGLWLAKDDGWQFHDWAEYQPSRVQVEADRHASRARQRRAREAAKSRRTNDVTDGEVTPESRRDGQRESRQGHGPPDPTRPVPSSGTGPQSSTDRTARGRIDDDGLDKIADATHGNRDHASRVAADILTRANGDVRNPLGYVLKTIGETPERYRANSGRHPPGPRDPRCPTHPGEHRDRCRGCAADRLAARPSADAGVGASDEPPW